MLDIILRFLYRRFTARFNDYLVEDYVKNIPEQTWHNGLNVLQSQKRNFQKLTDYMAFQLHRRMSKDRNNSERYQGMFIQLKMFDQIIQGRPDPEHEVVDKPVKELFDYSQAIDKASNFAAKAKGSVNV